MAKETIQTYFDLLQQHGDWQSCLADKIIFNSPNAHTTSKTEYLESTKGFYSFIQSVAVKGLIAEGDQVSAVATYQLENPAGKHLACEVAEFYTVSNGKIQSLNIYFDTAPFSTFLSRD